MEHFGLKLFYKTCLETKWQARSITRPVLILKFCQDQDQYLFLTIQVCDSRMEEQRNEKMAFDMSDSKNKVNS